jgi:hypothetical protein
MFPLAWILRVAYPHSPTSEYLNVFANFMAKVLFSSSIMYGNYMTISQRRLIAQHEAENAHRVNMVAELKDAVMRKDQFMRCGPFGEAVAEAHGLGRGAGVLEPPQSVMRMGHMPRLCTPEARARISPSAA